MGIVLNKEELLKDCSEENIRLREHALEILEAGLEAIDTGEILRKKLHVEGGVLKVTEPPSLNIREGFGGELDLKSFNKIIFVGIGKCALDGAKVIKEILGDFLTQGAVIDVKDAKEAEDLVSDGKIKYFTGTHPLPSEQNIEATKEILEIVKNLTEKDLVITLISGGGSALFELPAEGFVIEDIIKKTKELTAKGADIYELNKARKEMSQVKGGKFAEICHPAHTMNLIFSDVLGNDVSVIASGPTVAELPSPSQGEGLGGEVVNILLCSNRDALDAMRSKAKELGYDSKIETETLSGNAAEVGKQLAKRNIDPGTCILFGGETTVVIMPPASAEAPAGKGGRNQELALSALMNIPDGKVIISAASDGFDNTDHAGAVVDLELLEKSERLGLNPQEFLERSDSYNFFKNAGGAIFTGKLGSNVSDLVIMLSNGQAK